MDVKDMSKEDVIFEILLSLNKGNCREAESRVDLAIKQYNQLKEAGLVDKNNVCITHPCEKKFCIKCRNQQILAGIGYCKSNNLKNCHDVLVCKDFDEE